MEEEARLCQEESPAVSVLFFSPHVLEDLWVS